MAEYLQDNRRAVVILAVLLAAAGLIGLFLVLTSGGSDEAETLSSVEHATPTPTATQEDPGVSQTTTATTTRSVTRGSGANPFVPLPGTSDDPNADSNAPAANKNPDSNAPASSREVDPSSSSRKSSSDATSGSQNKDAAKEKTPKELAPQPIEKGADASTAVAVAVIDVHPNYLLARVNGQRTTLYLNVPDPSAMMYVSPLGGACAWIARTDGDTGERVSICEGETQDL